MSLTEKNGRAVQSKMEYRVVMFAPQNGHRVETLIRKTMIKIV